LFLIKIPRGYCAYLNDLRVYAALLVRVRRCLHPLLRLLPAQSTMVYSSREQLVVRIHRPVSDWHRHKIPHSANLQNLAHKAQYWALSDRQCNRDFASAVTFTFPFKIVAIKTMPTKTMLIKTAQIDRCADLYIWFAFAPVHIDGSYHALNAPNARFYPLLR